MWWNLLLLLQLCRPTKSWSFGGWKEWILESRWSSTTCLSTTVSIAVLSMTTGVERLEVDGNFVNPCGLISLPGTHHLHLHVPRHLWLLSGSSVCSCCCYYDSDECFEWPVIVPWLSLMRHDFFHTGCFFNWYPPKKLKYGKPRLGESTAS